MIPRIWLINVILALCVVAAGSSAYSVWVQEDPLRQEDPSKESSMAAVKGSRANERVILRESAYRNIAERTLFSPDRTEYLPEESDSMVEEETSIIQGKKINLYGVIIMDNDRKALIDNPNRKTGEPLKKWVRVGEMFGKVRVVAIESKSVSLAEGAKKYKIHLYTEKVASPSSADPARSRRSSSPTVVNSETKKEPSVRKIISSGAEKKKAPSKPDVEKQGEATEDFEIVNTPFGPVKKKRSD
jgi:hypothetical protein